MDTDIQIYRLPDIAGHYPPPKVPMLPVLTSDVLALGHHQSDNSRFFQTGVHFLSSGRMAFYYALKVLELAPGDEVLVPAYHCGSMLEPLIWLGLKPVFYRLDERLEIDLASVPAQLSKRTRVLLLPHFFGFPQPLAQTKDFCRQHQLLLIEDCAHSFFSKGDGLRLGYEGDFSLTSTVKFFPGNNGGALACNNPRFAGRLASLRRPGWKTQFKSLFNALETAAAYNKLGWFSRFFAIERPAQRQNEQSILQHFSTKCEQTRALNRESMQWFDPGQIGYRSTAFHRWLLYNSGGDEIMWRRRDNFCHYLKRLATVSAVESLHGSLADGIYPYVFPLVLKDPDNHFPRLKAAGVPIWRWEELAVSDCLVSKDYRLKLLQLPCHQTLSREELDWIIDKIIQVVTDQAPVVDIPAPELRRQAI